MNLILGDNPAYKSILSNGKRLSENYSLKCVLYRKLAFRVSAKEKGIFVFASTEGSTSPQCSPIQRRDSDPKLNENKEKRRK